MFFEFLVLALTAATAAGAADDRDNGVGFSARSALQANKVMVFCRRSFPQHVIDHPPTPSITPPCRRSFPPGVIDHSPLSSSHRSSSPVIDHDHSPLDHSPLVSIITDHSPLSPITPCCHRSPNIPRDTSRRAPRPIVLLLTPVPRSHAKPHFIGSVQFCIRRTMQSSAIVVPVRCSVATAPPVPPRERRVTPVHFRLAMRRVRSTSSVYHGA